MRIDDRESEKWGCWGSNYDGEGNTAAISQASPVSRYMAILHRKRQSARRIEHNDFVRGAPPRNNPRSKQRGTDSAVTLKGQRSRIDPERWRRYLAEDRIICLCVRYLSENLRF